MTSMRPKYDYVGCLISGTLGGSTEGLPAPKEVFTGFSTINPEYGQQLDILKMRLEDYIQDADREKPCLNLVLGAAGSGKSYLVQRLVKELRSQAKRRARDNREHPDTPDKREGPEIRYEEVNLSELTGPDDLYPLYSTIAKNHERKEITVVFLDECDVTWGGSSAIKYLIGPIYDGKFWDRRAGRHLSLGRCIFCFAGSYLQDRQTVVNVQNPLSATDVTEILGELVIQLQRYRLGRYVEPTRQLQDFLYTNSTWRAERDPRSDILGYLQQLEKVRDFLSRIGGNIFEIVDLSDPLSLTQNRYSIALGGDVKPSDQIDVGRIVRFVKAQDSETGRLTTFGSPSEPLLHFKNMLLCERLIRVVGMIKKRFRRKDVIGIERRLLNFLSVVPLLNGMRSLQQLIDLLPPPQCDEILVNSWNFADLELFVRNPGEYQSPTEVWNAVRTSNYAHDRLFPDGSSVVRLAL